MTGAAFTTDAPLPVGIAEEELAELTVYPNPVRGALYINLPHAVRSALELTIHDVKGIGILSTSYPLGASSAITLDVSDLQQGLYLVSIKSKTGVFVAKFYKQ